MYKRVKGVVPPGDLHLRTTAEWHDWFRTLQQCRIPLYNATRGIEFINNVSWLFALSKTTWIRTQKHCVLFLAIDIFKHYLEERDDSGVLLNTHTVDHSPVDQTTDHGAQLVDVCATPPNGSLVFLACVWIAMKVESNSCEGAIDFLEKTRNASRYTDFLATEIQILQRIQFNVHFPTAYTFIRGIAFQLVSDKQACKTLYREAVSQLKACFTHLFQYHPLTIACVCVTRSTAICFNTSTTLIQTFTQHLCNELQLNETHILEIITNLNLKNI